MQVATGKVVIVDHPLAHHYLTMLREKTTQAREFRQASDSLATILAILATTDLPGLRGTVETPLATAPGFEAQEVVLFPVLRAGLALAQGFQQALPKVRVHHIGIERDHQTAEPRRYYPPNGPRPLSASDCAIVVDPMLATGGTACDVINEVRKAGGRARKLVCVVASAEGVTRVHNEYPEVTIVTPVVDPDLNHNKYIVPGLGDYGDRYFGT